MLGPNSFYQARAVEQGEGGGFRINCVNSLARKEVEARLDCVCVGVGGLEV